MGRAGFFGGGVGWWVVGRKEEEAIGIEGIGKGMGGVWKRGCGHASLSEKREGDTQEGRWWG